MAHIDLGVDLTRQRNFKETIVHFREALNITPNYADAKKNLKLILDGQNKIVNAPH
jgi:hypothetical protein